MRGVFEDHVDQWYGDEADKILKQIDWDTWLYSPGLPPYTHDFGTPEVHEARKIADDYITGAGASSPANFEKYNDYFTSLRAMFIQELLDRVSEVTPAIMTRIDNDLHISEGLNSELLYLWYQTAIKCEYMTAPYAQVDTYLGTNGRMKFVTPI